MKSSLVLMLVTCILVGCTDPPEKVRKEETAAGKIMTVIPKNNANNLPYGPTVFTTFGLQFFLKNKIDVPLGVTATLKTSSYESGIIIRELCFEGTCTELRGMTF